MLIFFCSRNNYLVLKEWIKRNKYNPEDVTLVNFDVGSSVEAINEGKILCNEHNIIFEEADNPAIQACFKRAIELAKEISSEWVAYQQQDTWSITKDSAATVDFFWIPVPSFML